MSKEYIMMLAAVVSAGAAIIGVIIGSVSSYFISRQQIKAAVLSGNRQQWINTLRDCIADFQTNARIANVEAELANCDETSAYANSANHDEAMRAMCLLVNKISLLINPDEKDHFELISKMKDLKNHCTNGDPGDKQKEKMLQDLITSIGQKILKREWIRVKKLV